jgi:hypothetical protein
MEGGWTVFLPHSLTNTSIMASRSRDNLLLSIPSSSLLSLPEFNIFKRMLVLHWRVGVVCAYMR